MKTGTKAGGTVKWVLLVCLKELGDSYNKETCKGSFIGRQLIKKLLQPGLEAGVEDVEDCGRLPHKR